MKQPLRSVYFHVRNSSGGMRCCKKTLCFPAQESIEFAFVIYSDLFTIVTTRCGNGICNPACAQEAFRRGVNAYSTTCRLRIMGGPSLADRQKGGDMNQIESRSASGIDRFPQSIGLDLHYGFAEERDYIHKHQYGFKNIQ